MFLTMVWFKFLTGRVWVSSDNKTFGCWMYYGTISSILLLIVGETTILCLNGSTTSLVMNLGWPTILSLITLGLAKFLSVIIYGATWILVVMTYPSLWVLFWLCASVTSNAKIREVKKRVTNVLFICKKELKFYFQNLI